MAVLNVNPTRMELSRLKKNLTVALRGHKLLKDKRDELMRRFLELVKENMRRRIDMEQKVLEVREDFKRAGETMNEKVMLSALMPQRQVMGLEIEKKNVMSVEIPVYKTDESVTPVSYGFLHTSLALDKARAKMERLRGELLILAECEKACELMAAEIERTRRRVNALEHVMIPNYQDTIKYISMKLDESERSATIRLMKIKDTMIEERVSKSKTD